VHLIFFISHGVHIPEVHESVMPSAYH